MSARDKHKRSKSKKSRPVKDETLLEIFQQRDALLAERPADVEKIGQACKGAFRCAKDKDTACLDKIKANLSAIKKGGGKKRRSRSKTRSKSRSRSRSKH